MNNSDFELCLEIVKSANDQDQYSQMIIEFDKRYEKLNLRNADLRAQLAEARKDSERLDWIIEKTLLIGTFKDRYNIHPAGLWFNSPREAINNAMKGGE